MPTTEQYLTQLRVLQAALAQNLTTKGVAANATELFDTLVPKVLQISTGGGTNIKQPFEILADALAQYGTTYSYKAVSLVSNTYPDFINTASQGNSNQHWYTSDGGEYDGNTVNHTWDTAKDADPDALGYGTRWIMHCRSNETGYPIIPLDAVFVVIAGGTISNGSVLKDHKLMRSVKFQDGAKYGVYNMDYAGIYGCDALASIDGLDFGAASSIMNALSAKALTKIKNLKNLNNSFKIVAPYIDTAGINDIINDLKDCTGATQCTITLPIEIKNRLTTEQNAAITAKNWVVAQ